MRGRERADGVTELCVQGIQPIQRFKGFNGSKGVEMYRKMRMLLRRDAGMVTSEYAMGIIAAVGFAAVLYAVVTSGQVSQELQDIVKRALSARM